jgi:hypothetical protein
MCEIIVGPDGVRLLVVCFGRESWPRIIISRKNSQWTQRLYFELGFLVHFATNSFLFQPLTDGSASRRWF